MEKTAVQKLAGVLKILVTITFVCNLIVLPLVPVLVSVAGCQIPLPELLGNLTAEPPLPGDDWQMTESISDVKVMSMQN